MFKRNYYCLVAGLPDLFFNENRPLISSMDFCEFIKNDVSPADYELIKLILLSDDNKNLLTLLFNQNTDFLNSGNFSKTFLEEQQIQPTEVPDYMVDFLKWIKNSEQKELNILVENKLQNLYYDYVTQTNNVFLRDWFIFDLNIKNTITAINCSRYKYNLKDQLIQIKLNNVVNSLLIKNRFKPEYYEDELPFADEIFRVIESNSILIEKEKTIDQIKWKYLDEQTFFHYFTIEKILSFILKLKITERWMKLDKETGQALLNQLINELKTSYKFPAEFSTVK